MGTNIFITRNVAQKIGGDKLMDTQMFVLFFLIFKQLLLLLLYYYFVLKYAKSDLLHH